jgi:hypothetical protein
MNLTELPFQCAGNCRPSHLNSGHCCWRLLRRLTGDRPAYRPGLCLRTKADRTWSLSKRPDMLLAQLAFQDLAARVPGQRLGDDDPLWDLEVGQMLAGVLQHARHGKDEHGQPELHR